MKLSIIIPTYNEEKVLSDCIESLGFQTMTDFEIIIVDDGSTDKTLEMLENLKKTLPNFKFLKQNHKGAGAARNLGAKKARGEILVFVDADMTFDEKFLQNLTKPIIDGKERGTFSKEEYVSNWDNVWARCWNINEGWESKKRHPKNYPSTQPVFRAILKSEFEKVGGFTPGGYDDDWSLYRKLGYKAVNAPSAIFYHKNPGTMSEVFRHAQWVGKRKYKMGAFGYVFALTRSLFPVSIVVGLYKAFTAHCLFFIVFKVTYDLGIFVGILKYISSREGAK